MTSGFFPLVLAFFAGVFLLRLVQRSDGWIEMPEQLFWDLIAKNAPTDVFVVLRGTFFKRSCYVFANQGIVFFTWSRPTNLPAGITETLTFELRST
jgi:hypothetical protein